MNPAEFTLSGISPNLTTRPNPPPLSITQRTGKAPVPRVDLEPIYTQLKSALGDQWTDYKTAINAFVLGALSQAELGWVLQPLLSVAPPVAPPVTTSTTTTTAAPPVSTLNLHNTLLAAIYANTLRDPPPTEVAPWVVATDKPTAASKNAGASGANDKAEERLRKEVMAVHARDRRRIKTLKETGKPINDGFAEMQDYRNELAVRPPDVAPQSGGGIVKTNWDVQIKQRFAQNLAAETLEFPAEKDVKGRIEPICYEEGLVGGVAPGAMDSCVSLIEEATEIFLKELLGQMFAHTRANTEGCVQTSKFRRQVRKEEEDVDRGIVQRNASGLLPVEMEVLSKRDALNMEDIRLAVQLSDSYMKQDLFLSNTVLTNRYTEGSPETPKPNGVPPKPTTNGTLPTSERGEFEEAIGEDDPAWTWKGASRNDVNDLMGVLDECLLGFG